MMVTEKIGKMGFLNRYFLYGAGINAYGVLKYIGGKNVKGILDSAVDRIGKKLNDIKIVSLEDYIENGYAFPIVISAYQRSHEVIRILESHGLFNYLTAPYLQGSVTELSDVVTEILRNANGRNIVFDNTVNIMTVLIIDELTERGMQSRIRGCLDAGNISVLEYYGLALLDKNDLEENDFVVVTEENIHDWKEDFKVGFYVCNYLYYNKAYRNEKLSAFKKLYQGKRCFVIGNGPSLRMEDLDILAYNHEISFASNKIYMAFDDTIWRPDYYVIADFVKYLESYDVVKNFDGSKVFMRRFYNMLDRDYIPGANIYHSLPQKDKFLFSDDIAEVVYSGVTVTYNMLQIAAYMGFNEIYLLGMDFSFGEATGKETSHFHKDYEKEEKVRGIFYYEENLAAYQAAEDYSRKSGFRIYNATRGGCLEVFERVDFDKLMEKC